MTIFLENKIESSIFEENFLHIRRNDTYLFSSLYDENICSILDTMFLDVDEYCSEEQYDPDYKFNINEAELRKRIEEHLSLLNKFLA